MTKLWFAAKRYGYGWYPVTWEGMVITLIYVVGVASPVPLLTWLGVIDDEADIVFIGIFLLYVIIMTIGLIWICVKKGEKARWRWGNK